MVPPRCAMPRTDSRVRETTSSSPSRPAKPRLIPSTSQLRLTAESTAERITALSPGASPPPVEMPRRMPSFREQLEDLPRARVTLEPGLLEDHASIASHLESPATGRNQLHVGIGIL